MTVVVSGLLVLAAVVVAWRRYPIARRRVRRILPTGQRRAWRLDPIRFVALSAGCAVVLFVDGVPGVVAAVLVGYLTDRVLRRLESPAARRSRLAAAADLPFAVDLVAACLRAGLPLAQATQNVASSLGGPLGERLALVAHALRLGAPATEAWAPLQDVPGADRVAVAAIRSSQSGAALAGALTRLADELRADRITASEAAARRAGVLVVLPLGVCFLPAFVLAGLVPVVLSVLGEVLP